MIIDRSPFYVIKTGYRSWNHSFRIFTIDIVPTWPVPFKKRLRGFGLVKIQFHNCEISSQKKFAAFEESRQIWAISAKYSNSSASSLTSELNTFAYSQVSTLDDLISFQDPYSYSFSRHPGRIFYYPFGLCPSWIYVCPVSSFSSIIHPFILCFQYRTILNFVLTAFHRVSLSYPIEDASL